MVDVAARPIGTLALSLLAACTPPRAHYGAAHYAPERRGYVVGSGADMVVLRDPLTADKIRCRERLVEVAPALAAALGDRLHDRQANTVSHVALLPLHAPGQALVLAANGLFALSILPAAAAAPPSRRSLYARAGEAFGETRYADAASLYEQALDRRNDGVLESSSARLDELTVYYLAASLEQAGSRDRARAAYRAFVDRGAGAHEEAYRYAEAALHRLGEPVSPCASQEPMEMPWSGGAQ